MFIYKFKGLSDNFPKANKILLNKGINMIGCQGKNILCTNWKERKYKLKIVKPPMFYFMLFFLLLVIFW